MKTQHYFLATLFVIIASCSSRSSSDSMEAGDSITEQRDLSGVSELKITGIINLYLSQGDQESIRIEGEEKAISLLEVTQTGSRLEIGYKDEDQVKTIFEEFTPDIYLTISDLSNLSFEGVGNIETKSKFQVKDLSINGNGIGKIDLEVNAESISANFNMMGNIVLRGDVGIISLQNEGMGKIDASQLISKKMTLNTSGIGKVDVFCEEELSITVNGIGAVNYSGNPKVIKEEINGIGKVTRN